MTLKLSWLTFEKGKNVSTSLLKFSAYQLAKFRPLYLKACKRVSFKDYHVSKSLAHWKSFNPNFDSILTQSFHQRVRFLLSSCLSESLKWKNFFRFISNCTTVNKLQNILIYCQIYITISTVKPACPSISTYVHSSIHHSSMYQRPFVEKYYQSR